MSVSLLKFFRSKNNVFFGLFNQSAANNVEMAKLLYKAVSSDSDQEIALQFNHINRLKMKGNDLKHQVYAVSSKSLITPFERDDMYALASAINEVCDSIHVSARRVNLYKLNDLAPAVKELAGLIIETSMELSNCVKYLEDLDNVDDISACCNKIKQLERYADQVYDKALTGKWPQETQSIEMIKYTEILAALETATDKCEDAIPVIESIIVKNK
ncbi:DUF47 family protein [Mucilaginibacter sp. Bleaf8]|uniref:DUF47 domain-containing protein n=1 Tax=Mucilaginibacter sp. Bleaf8 TaxID=2834430 RepID=UPI001BD0087D|nr:DUF47 family protein [Mucilaginibacter sp. Bleaf8]MBS7564937.1 DUF47 family protein [Mucilaginibacter sp. Bleaf8]